MFHESFQNSTAIFQNVIMTMSNEELDVGRRGIALGRFLQVAQDGFNAIAVNDSVFVFLSEQFTLRNFPISPKKTESTLFDALSIQRFSRKFVIVKNN